MKKWETMMEKRIANHYKRAYRDVEKLFMEKSKRMIGEEEALKIKLKAGVITEGEFNAWRKKAEKELHKQVNILADTLNKADKAATGEANKNIIHAYAEGMNEQLYEVEKYGIKSSFDLVSDSSVSKAARGRFMKAINLKKNTAWNRRRITSAITSSILRGDSIPQVAKALLPIVNGNKRSALLNARTWVNSARNGGHYEQAERLDKAGIRMKKIWLSAGDDRVRDSHRELDGEERYIDEPFSNGGMYPADPSLDAEEYYNCRCTVLNFPEGYEPDLNNRTMDIEESYEDWKAGR